MTSREALITCIDRVCRTGFSRSSGAGGQNVNKVNTKALISVALADLTVLSGEERDRLASKLRTRLTKEGELKLQAQDERTQSRNLALAVERLADLILNALRMPKKRKKTRMPAAARARRLEKKKKNTAKKKLRRSTHDSD